MPVTFLLSNKSIFNGGDGFKHLKVFSFCHVFDTHNVDNDTARPSFLLPLSAVCLFGQLTKDQQLDVQTSSWRRLVLSYVTWLDSEVLLTSFARPKARHSEIKHFIHRWKILFK